MRWLLVLPLAACSIDERALPATGRVVEPSQGAVVAGDPAGVHLRVAGTYADASRELAILVLANPADLTSWTTVVTTKAATPAGDTFGFAEELPAMPADRWPKGGVFRVRVVDDTGAPLPVESVDDPADDGVVAVVNPAEPPAGWTYLTRKPNGSLDETRAYYTAINAPKTLTDFKARFGFTGDEASALYYNAGDLGIGREMHCRATDVGGAACYVRNFGTFGGDQADAFAQAIGGDPPLATVAMVYTPPATAPNAVQFMVYAPNDRITLSAKLDSHGDNISIPQNCLNCHGGKSTYDATSHAAGGARFLPFDPGAFAFDTRSDLTLASQEASLRALDEIVLGTSPSDAVKELVAGALPASGYDPAFVPDGWNATPRDARVYREVVAPYCRSCHTSFDGSLALTRAEDVRMRSSSMVDLVCGAGPHGMPAAEQTSRALYASSARAVWLSYLGAPGACAP